MAEQIISPGVFTRENDLSFLPAGVQQIGAAVIGPTVKGPAFVPTVVKSFSEFERRFGPLDQKTFVPQTVREYLRNAGAVTVCRILAGGGYMYTTTNSPTYFVVGKTGVGNMAVQKKSFKIENYQPKKATIVAGIFPSLNEATPDLAHSEIVTPNAAGTFNMSGSVFNGKFKFKLSGSQGGSHISAGTSNMFSGSMDPASTDYVPNRLGYTPGNSENALNTFTGDAGYFYLNFRNIQKAGQSTSVTSGVTVVNSVNTNYPQIYDSSLLTTAKQNDTLFFSGSIGDEKYQNASTPWIQSQLLGSPVSNLPAEKDVKNLFKVHTLNHGTSTNTDYKISIQDLRDKPNIDNEEQYSTFTLLVRKYSDTDKSPVVLETFSGLTLDPNSPNYIARAVGDRYPQYNETLGKVEMLGNYPNISNYVRVEMDVAVEARSISPKLMPKGFAAVTDPVVAARISMKDNSDGTVYFPSASYELSQSLGVDNTYNPKGYLGWRFSEKDADNNNWILPLPSTAPEGNVSGRFNVDNGFGHAESSLFTKSLSGSSTGVIDVTGDVAPTPNQLKFSVPFQGGNDGVAPYTPRFTGAESTLATLYTDGDNLYGFDMNQTSAAGYKGYKKALDIIENQDEYDINMLVLPGVVKEHHSLITNAGIDMCESRGDTFFVMDLSNKDASVNETVSHVSGLDTNYAAVYYPWVKVLDTSINKPVFVPPSVIVPGAIAASDRIGAEWFAPAGLNRGILGNVLEAKIRLNQAERDILYDNKINPIATFPRTGVCIWGQKTLQERSTALDRINVRRLLINLKKFIASSSKFLVFEQNTIETRDRFLNIVNPYLETVQQQQGLYAFRVQMDEGNNTPTVIDRNQLVGAIFLQPAKTAEFIVLDFNVLPTGATFPS